MHLDSGIRRGFVRPTVKWLLVIIALSAFSGCGLIQAQVTDCDTHSQSASCQRNERFKLAETTIVVNELETSTETGGDAKDIARVEAQITLDSEPKGQLQAQLRIVDSLTDEVTIIGPDAPPTVAGTQTLTWDFSDRGWAWSIQNGSFPPDIFVVFSDVDREVTVTVMSIEYS